MRYAIDNEVVARRGVVPDSTKLYEVGRYVTLAAFIYVPEERFRKSLFAPYQNSYALHKSLSFFRVELFACVPQACLPLIDLVIDIGRFRASLKTKQTTI